MSYSVCYNCASIPVSLTEEALKSFTAELAKKLAYFSTHEEAEQPTETTDAWDDVIDNYDYETEEEAEETIAEHIGMVVRFSGGVVNLSGDTEDGYSFFLTNLLTEQLLPFATSYATLSEHYYDSREGCSGEQWFIGEDGEEVTSSELARHHFA